MFVYGANVRGNSVLPLFLVEYFSLLDNFAHFLNMFLQLTFLIARAYIRNIGEFSISLSGVSTPSKFYLFACHFSLGSNGSASAYNQTLFAQTKRTKV